MVSPEQTFTIFRPAVNPAPEWPGILARMVEQDLDSKPGAIEKMLQPAFSPRLTLITPQEIQRFHAAIGFNPSEDQLTGLVDHIKGDLPESAGWPLEDVPTLPCDQQTVNSRSAKRETRWALRVAGSPIVQAERTAALRSLRIFYELKRLPRYVFSPPEEKRWMLAASAKRSWQQPLLNYAAGLMTTRAGLMPETTGFLAAQFDDGSWKKD